MCGCITIHLLLTGIRDVLAILAHGEHAQINIPTVRSTSQTTGSREPCPATRNALRQRGVAPEKVDDVDKQDPPFQRHIAKVDPLHRHPEQHAVHHRLTVVLPHVALESLRQPHPRGLRLLRRWGKLLPQGDWAEPVDAVRSCRRLQQFYVAINSTRGRAIAGAHRTATTAQHRSHHEGPADRHWPPHCLRWHDHVIGSEIQGAGARCGAIICGWKRVKGES